MIKHLHIKDLTSKEIKTELDNVHSISAPTIVYNWVMNLNVIVHPHDAPRSRHPIETATPEIIDKVHDIVLTDRRVKVRELVVVCHRHITWHNDFNFARTIGYEKVIDKIMDVMFAHWTISATVQ